MTLPGKTYVASQTGQVTAGGHRLEFAWHGRRIAGACPIVLLHEGLGSVAMWRDFPGMVAEATGQPVLAYSRRGHGRSDALTEPRPPRFLHEEAQETLPELLEALGVDRSVLIGHGDGASIALLYAASRPTQPYGLVGLAPHLFAEPRAIEAVRMTTRLFHESDLRARLARFHKDVDGMFRAWSETWLDPSFGGWSIERETGNVRCPVLAIQGIDDHSGTMRQIDRLAELVPDTELLKLEQCRHSPHVDQPEKVLEAISRFVARVTAA